MSTLVTATRLTNRRVFLSASIPLGRRGEKYHRVSNASLWITESVMALTRAVLSHGGELVMSAHPTISPLIAQVAGEYRHPTVVEGERRRMNEEQMAYTEPRVIIYQSKVFKTFVPEETLFLERLGYARIIWTDAIENETFSPRRRQRVPPAPKSLRHMREQMLKDTAPDTMVCIGGMESVIEESRIFTDVRPHGRIYALATTGGAASVLSSIPGISDVVRAMDLEILRDLERLWSEFPVKGEGNERLQHDETPMVEPPSVSRHAIYPLVMQSIVDELGGENV